MNRDEFDWQFTKLVDEYEEDLRYKLEAALDKIAEYEAADKDGLVAQVIKLQAENNKLAQALIFSEDNLYEARHKLEYYEGEKEYYE